MKAIIGHILCFFGLHEFVYADSNEPFGINMGVAGKHECSRIDCTKGWPRVEWPKPPE